ncbi:hypothetical protein ACE103_17705 [Bradyrhizobium sp. ma5]|uniref:hypothetical protein n=1 Tax=Bradyrhizobium sp. ma5 TaxID=3344828 RepID=UPI0035D464CD
MSDFTNFRAVYDELTDEVSRSRHQFVAGHLQNWFRHLDETPQVSEVIQDLQADLDFDAWYAEQKENSQGMGPGVLNYPADSGKQLGLKLLLFRHFAAGKEVLWQFAHGFISSSRDLNVLTHDAIDQVFGPMARELRRYLEGETAKRSAVPASDRSVRVDHNSADYARADQALDELEEAVRAANTFDDPEEKEQREAEVSAARRLIRAVRVRLEPLAELLKPLLVQFGTNLKDNLVKAAAAAASAALIALFGYLLKTLLGL